MRKAGTGSWQAQPLVNAYTDNARGVGLADLAHAIREGRAHRCHSDLAFHVLDVMEALHESSDAGQRVTIQSRCEQPAPLPLGAADGGLGRQL